MKRKFLTLLSVAAILCLVLLAFTACGGITPIEIGSNGNWYVDGEDTGIRANGEDGRDGSVVYIGDNKNWYIDGYDTGVKAEISVTVTDIKVTYNTDEYGYEYSTTTVYFSDDSSKSVISYLPIGIEGINLNYYSAFPVFDEGEEPTLMLTVFYEDDSTESIPVTDDMFVGDKPDFTTAGTYPCHISYKGNTANASITVREPEADYRIESVSLVTSAVAVGADADDIIVNVTARDSSGYNSYSYNVKLSDCTLNKNLNTSESAEAVVDFSYGSVSKVSTITVYDPETEIISSVDVMLGGPLTVDRNTSDDELEDYIKEELVGSQLNVSFYDRYHGKRSMTDTVSASMINISKVDTSKLGDQQITVTYSVDGYESASCKVTVKVIADISSASVNTVYAADTDLSGLGMGIITLYDNAIAVVNGAHYDYTLRGSTLEVENASGKLYYTVDSGSGIYNVYIPEGSAKKTYTNSDEGMVLKVYDNYIVIYADTGSDNIAAYCTANIINTDNNTFKFLGMTFTLNSNGTFTFK